MRSSGSDGGQQAKAPGFERERIFPISAFWSDASFRENCRVFVPGKNNKIKKVK
jgi:hypothetical protein